MPTSITFGKNLSWVKVILNFSNKGPAPFQSVDNYKNAK
jgi:hypothetical protein